jgi:hypothetical protein
MPEKDLLLASLGIQQTVVWIRSSLLHRSFYSQQYVYVDSMPEECLILMTDRERKNASNLQVQVPGPNLGTGRPCSNVGICVRYCCIL